MFAERTEASRAFTLNDRRFGSSAFKKKKQRQKNVTSDEDVQQMWRDRWSDQPTKVLPSCYDRPAFVEIVRSDEFDVEYENEMTKSCGHWLPGGNAFSRTHGDGAKGQRFDWADCDGCKWKV